MSSHCRTYIANLIPESDLCPCFVRLSPSAVLFTLAIHGQLVSPHVSLFRSHVSFYLATV